jgi:hypothetical protein
VRRHELLRPADARDRIVGLAPAAAKGRKRLVAVADGARVEARDAVKNGAVPRVERLRVFGSVGIVATMCPMPR